MVKKILLVEDNIADAELVRIAVQELGFFNNVVTTNGSDEVFNYLENNRFRMNYKLYRSKNWLIGSGPIESAQRTIVQQRLKLSGQRWNIQNAQNVLNLRTCHMSNQWQTVVNKCRCAA